MRGRNRRLAGGSGNGRLTGRCLRRGLVVILAVAAALAVIGTGGCSAGEDGEYSWPGSGSNTEGGDGNGNGTGTTPTGHVHDWGDWVVTVPATCEASGNETRTCKIDNSHKETRTIPRLSGTACESGGGDVNNCGKDGTADFCKTVVIGTQTWMAENLNRESGFSWCYNNNNANCNMFGRLYDWPTAMGLGAVYTTTEWGGNDNGRQGVCPNGWHLPSRAEWNTLITEVGGSAVAGERLKAKTGWNPYSGKSGNGTDNYGFSALAGGRRTSDGYFENGNYYGNWWTATEYGSERAYYISMGYGYASVDQSYGYKNYGYSVRCVQN